MIVVDYDQRQWIYIVDICCYDVVHDVLFMWPTTFYHDDSIKQVVKNCLKSRWTCQPSTMDDCSEFLCWLVSATRGGSPRLKDYEIIRRTGVDSVADLACILRINMQIQCAHSSRPTLDYLCQEEQSSVFAHISIHSPIHACTSYINYYIAFITLHTHKGLIRQRLLLVPLDHQLNQRSNRDRFVKKWQAIFHPPGSWRWIASASRRFQLNAAARMDLRTEQSRWKLNACRIGRWF